MDFLDPLRRRVVRRVCTPGDVVEEEGHRGLDVVELLHPMDGVVGHRGGQVPGWMANVGIDRLGVVEQMRLPLAGVAAAETVEVLEAQASRPLIEWSRLARHPFWRVVVLAEPGGAVAIFKQNAPDRR